MSMDVDDFLGLFHQMSYQFESDYQLLLCYGCCIILVKHSSQPLRRLWTEFKCVSR